MEVVELHSSPRTRHAQLPASLRSRVLTLQSFNTDTGQVSAGARLDPQQHIYSDKSTEQMLQVCATNEQRGERSLQEL